MMYKVPMPNGSNGVKLFRLPNLQIGIEYTQGVPHVGELAFDSAHGLSRDVSFGSGTPEGGVSDEISKRGKTVGAAVDQAGRNRALT